MKLVMTDVTTQEITLEICGATVDTDLSRTPKRVISLRINTPTGSTSINVDVSEFKAAAEVLG